MLKNKKAVYILVPLNLLIWGFFAYRFYTAFSEGDEPVVTSRMPGAKVVVSKDSVNYKLRMDYKDPFLKESRQEAQSGSQNYRASSADPAAKKNPAPVKIQAAAPVKPLPEIKYLGLIKNNSSGLSTALISLNGQSRLIKQNETIDGIVFKSFNKDSLVARWGKERIVARK